MRILTTQTEESWLPSEASKLYRKQFKEVMVDEYQDINQLQEAILYWLRQPDPTNGNLFMVGDVKQSIYSFRLADPSLFIENMKHLQQLRVEDGSFWQKIFVPERKSCHLPI